MPNIEIPEPVITAEVDWDATSDTVWSVSVYIGTGYNKVEVLTASVLRDWHRDVERYAVDSEEAESYALEEFALRMKRLLNSPAALGVVL